MVATRRPPPHVSNVAGRVRSHVASPPVALSTQKPSRQRIEIAADQQALAPAPNHRTAIVHDPWTRQVSRRSRSNTRSFHVLTPGYKMQPCPRCDARRAGPCAWLIRRLRPSQPVAQQFGSTHRVEAGHQPPPASMTTPYTDALLNRDCSLPHIARYLFRASRSTDSRSRPRAQPELEGLAAFDDPPLAMAVDDIAAAHRHTNGEVG